MDPPSDPLSPLLPDHSDLRDIFDHPSFVGDGRPGTYGNGTASGTTIHGGTLQVEAGGFATGAITFGAGSGTLQIDSTTMPTGTITGFATSDTIDLTGIAYVAGATATRQLWSAISTPCGTLGTSKTSASSVSRRLKAG